MAKDSGESSSSHVANVFSRLELAAAERERESYLKALLTQPISARVCVPIPLVKSEVVSSIRLRTKEAGLLMSMTRSRVLKYHSFVNHENVSICYCPNVLKGHAGSYSLSLVNPDTCDIKVICVDAPIDEARLYVFNWPRSVPSAQNLFLNYECDGSDAGLGVQLGLFKILWDEKPSFKMIQVKDMPAMVIPIPETDSVLREFSNRQLEQFLHRLMLPGTQSNERVLRRVSSNLRISGPLSSSDLPRVREVDSSSGIEHPVILGQQAEGGTTDVEGPSA